MLAAEKIFQGNLELLLGGSESVRQLHPTSIMIEGKPGWPSQGPGGQTSSHV